MRQRLFFVTCFCLFSLGFTGFSSSTAAVRSPAPQSMALETIEAIRPSSTPAAQHQLTGLVTAQTIQTIEDHISRTNRLPLLDGICRPSEYDAAAKLWLNVQHTIYVQAIFGRDSLYLCTNILFGPAGSDSRFTVYFNRDGAERVLPGSPDLRFQATPNGQFEVSAGDGNGFTGSLPTLIASKVITGNQYEYDEEAPPLDVPWWADEVRIPLVELAPFTLGEPLHIAFHYQGFVADPSAGGFPWNDLVLGDWPSTLDEQRPNTWGAIATLAHDIYLPVLNKTGAAAQSAISTENTNSAGSILIPNGATDSAPIAPKSQSSVPHTEARSQPTVDDFNAACPDINTPLFPFDRNAKWPMVDPANNPIVQAEGTLSSIRISPEDSPWIHDSHDVDMEMVPAPSSAWVMLSGHSELVLETESRGFLAFARPMPGDHVTVVGRWIFDCGHDPKTEVHPTPVFESDRFELRRVQADAPLQKVRVVRVRLNTDPGAFQYQFENGYAFTFQVELPPGQVNPFIGFVTGDSQFVSTSTNGNIATVTIRAPAQTGQWYWEFMLGRNLPENTSNLRDTYTVHLNKVDIFDDHDHGFPDCGGIFDLGDCGEWTMNVNMNGSWGAIFDKTTVDEDDGPYDLHIALPVTGERLVTYVEGYDDDDPFRGDDIASGTRDLGALVDLCCEKPQEFAFGGDWRLFYSVTKDDGRPLPPDLLPPTTVISLSPPPQGGWYLQDVLVTVNATDDLSGVAVTECRVNGRDWFVYALPFTVSEEGFNNSVECFSRDKSGHIEEPKGVTFNLDKFPPTSRLLVTGQVYGSVGDVTQIGVHHTLTLNALDTVFSANALQVEYRVYKDGTAPGAFSAPLPNGTTFSLPTDAGGFGLWHVDFRAADPAHTFDTLAPDEFNTQSFFISTRITEGLQAFYPFDEGTGVVVHDYSWTGTPLDLQIPDTAAIAWVPGGLSVQAPTVIASTDQATKLTRAVSDTNELTIEAWIQPTSPALSNSASIVTLATDTISRDVTLSQLPGGNPARPRFDVRLRTSKTSRKGVSVRSERQLPPSAPMHLVYTRDALGIARLYINGNLQDAETISGKLSAWGDARLALGNELVGGLPWIGTYHLVAFYSRALSPAEIRQNFAGGASGDGSPGTITELQTLYRFDEVSGPVVHDQAGIGTPLDLQIGNPTVTAWSPGGLIISGTTLLASTVPATRLTRAISGTNEVSLEAWVRPADARQETLARILSLANDAVVRNLELVQEREEGHEETHFTVRLRTTDTTRAGEPALATPKDSVKPTLQHVVYTRDALGVARIYINGAKVADMKLSGNLTNWDEAYQLVLANTLTGNRPWLGEYQRVAIYNRALSPAEVIQHIRVGPAG